MECGIKEVKEEEDKEYCIPGEFIANGYNDNILKHETGVVSMARASYGNQSTEILKIQVLRSKNLYYNLSFIFLLFLLQYIS